MCVIPQWRELMIYLKPIRLCDIHPTVWCHPTTLFFLLITLKNIPTLLCFTPASPHGRINAPCLAASHMLIGKKYTNLSFFRHNCWLIHTINIDPIAVTQTPLFSSNSN